MKKVIHGKTYLLPNSFRDTDAGCGTSAVFQPRVGSWRVWGRTALATLVPTDFVNRAPGRDRTTVLVLRDGIPARTVGESRLTRRLAGSFDDRSTRSARTVPDPGTQSGERSICGTAPICWSASRKSVSAQASATSPSATRVMTIPGISTETPVAGIPMNSPSWVPRYV